LHNVSHWQIYAVQMEEERGESPNCLPVDIDNSSNVTFANLYLYRVAGNTPFPYAVKLTASHDIRFRNVHVYSPGKFTFDNTIFDQTHNVEIRSREIASLNVSGNPPRTPPTHESPVLAHGAKVEKLAVDLITSTVPPLIPQATFISSMRGFNASTAGHQRIVT